LNELLYLAASAWTRLQSDPRGLVEIALTAAIVYWLISIIQGTTAMTILRGLVILYLAGALLANLFGLSFVSWLLRSSINFLAFGLIVIFGPELRNTLEQVGRSRALLRRGSPATVTARTIDTVARAASRLAEHGWGALLVLERETGLGEYVDTGTRIDAALSQELLLNIFFPHAPLHDGAVLLREDRVLAAAALLPLSDTSATGGHLGTRHRAAIGISERTDALCVVISEETGHISIANNGRMVRNLDEEKLRKVLEVLYRPTLRRARLPQLPLVGRVFARRSEAQPHA
jgi:diadenylate cyclase